VTDRIEIDVGSHRVGRAVNNDVVISAGPDHLGLLVLKDDGTATLDSGNGPEAFVAVAGHLPHLKTTHLHLELTGFEGQAALRVRDLNHPARTGFPGIQSFPLDPAWRILADWEELPAAETLGIGTVAGLDTSVKITHRASFTHEGQAITLLPTHWKSGKPMFVIRDATSGKETYGASRFLIGEEQDGKMVLDFNRAFNPPCAFTVHAVCPLPPRDNILPFAIRAGEKQPSSDD